MRLGFSKAVIVRVSFICGFILIGFGLSMVMENFIKKPVPPQNLQDLNIAATVLTDPIALPNFSLLDHSGTAFTRDNLKGKWRFLFFGYTHCPDVCPMTLSLLDQVYKLLQKQDMQPLPQVIFVSVDSERDNNVLADYVLYFNPAFLGVTGTENQLQKLMNPLGIFSIREENASVAKTDNYLINHSSSIFLIDPDIRLRAIISPPFNIEEIVDNFKRIKRIFTE